MDRRHPVDRRFHPGRADRHRAPAGNPVNPHRQPVARFPVDRVVIDLACDQYVLAIEAGGELWRHGDRAAAGPRDQSHEGQSRHQGQRRP